MCGPISVPFQYLPLCQYCSALNTYRFLLSFEIKYIKYKFVLFNNRFDYFRSFVLPYNL